MTTVHWILLIVLIIVVGGAYWYLRRHNGSDPWHGMEEPDDADGVSGMSLGGDSYIVGVRTLTPEEVAGNDAGQAPTASSEAEAEVAWEAYKRMSGAEQDADAGEAATEPAPAAARRREPTLEPQDRPEPAEPKPEPAVEPKPESAAEPEPAAEPKPEPAAEPKPEPKQAPVPPPAAEKPVEPEPSAQAEAPSADEAAAPESTSAAARWIKRKTRAMRKPTAAPAPQPEPETKTQSPTEPPAPQRPSSTARMENIRPVRPPEGEENLFVLYINRADGRHLDGPDIHAALHAEGLKFGLHDLYHRVTDANGEIESVYCVANMLKPGVLDPSDQDHLQTPGLTMFLVLPGAIEGRRAMHDMMETANALAQRLGGQVLDDQRNVLKKQSAQYMFDQIAEIDRRARLQKAR